jgi:hypothetical protein
MKSTAAIALPVPEMEEASAPPVPTRPTANPLVPTIFHEPWWLEIVTGGNYAATEVNDHGRTVGRLYYFLRRRSGLKYSIMPPMTHFLGPAIIDNGGDPPTRFLRRATITRELIQQLPPAAIYQYKCHRDVTDAIAFQQEKFHTSVQFTYEIYPDTEEVLWKNLRSKKQRIRSAQREVTVSHLTDPLEFWRFYDANWQKKGIANACDQEMCCRLIEGCLSRDRGRIYGAFDKNHRLVAAAFLLWDETSCYYFLSSRTPDAHYGASSLLVWEGMKEAAKRGLIFDFDGLNNTNAVLFFTQFGGTIRPRYIVTRRSLLGGIALGIKHARRENRYFY